MSAFDILRKLEGIEAGSLKPLQRILLVTDGTLTEILEAAFLEPIRLVKASQNIIPSAAAPAQLAGKAEEAFLERKIFLQGERSNRNYVYARSVIAIDRLPVAFREDLARSDISLGRLWLQHKLETFKEMVEIRSEPAGELGRYFKREYSDALLVRTYRVFSAAVPVMLISEYFSAAYE